MRIKAIINNVIISPARNNYYTKPRRYTEELRKAP